MLPYVGMCVGEQRSLVRVIMGLGVAVWAAGTTSVLARRQPSIIRDTGGLVFEGSEFALGRRSGCCWSPTR